MPRPIPMEEAQRILPKIMERAKRQPDGCLNHGRSGEGRGYAQVQGQYAHRVVCTVEHGMATEDAIALHTCNNYKCVEGKHLHWGTEKANAADRVRAGTTSYMHRSSRFLTDKVYEICQRSMDGESVRDIAQSLGVSTDMIRRVRSGKTYHTVARPVGWKPILGRYKGKAG